jgi:hypothetical protein
MKSDTAELMQAKYIHERRENERHAIPPIASHFVPMHDNIH